MNLSPEDFALIDESFGWHMHELNRKCTGVLHPDERHMLFVEKDRVEKLRLLFRKERKQR